jgi:ribosomal protein S18 acetylase RimI-like enzyme
MSGPVEPDGFVVGTALSDGFGSVIDDAVLSMNASNPERAYASSLEERVRKGDVGVFTLLHYGRTVGVLFYRAVDGEAELVFGHVLREYRGKEGFLLKMSISALSAMKINIIRAGMAWPRPDGFINDAMGLGFVCVERKSMSIENYRYVPGRCAPGGVRLAPWDPKYTGEACILMSQEAAPVDKMVFPLFSTRSGSMALLRSILDNKHGSFLPGLSVVASSDGMVVGILLASSLTDGSILVLDVAVSKEYRRKGIGSAMMERMIVRSNEMGRRKIVLAVTTLNIIAIKLYHHMGFEEISGFKQYVYYTPSSW